MKIMETATFAAGCFWGVEMAFRRVPGVTGTRVGYTGGTVEDPGYERVCTGQTGHAEAVEVTFDPARLGYDDLLEVFWAAHDPTQLDRQGFDVGSQYRSAIFTHGPEQEAAARASMERLESAGRSPGQVVTRIEPAGRFYQAEDYHQRYLEKQGRGRRAGRLF
jgi:peptide-methionine (S)-S-oxide reductase